MRNKFTFFFKKALNNKIVKSIIILIFILTIIIFSLFIFNYGQHIQLIECGALTLLYPAALVEPCYAYAIALGKATATAVTNTLAGAPSFALPTSGTFGACIAKAGGGEAALAIGKITIWFNNINYNLILILMSKLCFWFSIGIKLYLNISEGKLGLYLQNKIYIINNLTFLQLTLIYFIVFYIISITMDIIVLNIITGGAPENYFNNINKIESYMAENQNNTSSNTKAQTNVNIANSPSDSAIIAASMAAGTQLAKNAPTIGQKALILSTSTAIGLGAIGVKNIINNVTGDLGQSSKKLLPFNPINDLDLSGILGLTGNSAFDLIKMINYFQTIQLIVSYFIAYNLFFYIIDFTYIINKLNKMFPGSTGQKLILIFSNYISKIKKVSLIFLTIFIILNLICAYVNSNTIEFVYANFDSIIELYIKNKNN